MVIVHNSHTSLHACNKHKALLLLWLRMKFAQRVLAHAHLKKAEELSKDLVVLNGDPIFFFIRSTLRQQSATSFSYQSVQVSKWKGTLTGRALLGQQKDEAFWGRFLKCRRLPR